MSETPERRELDSVPPAPWLLGGDALVILGLVRTRVARRFVRYPLAPVSVLPGLTLGGLILAEYTASPVGPYHELLLLAGLVRYGGRLGCFISHAYVDSEASRAAGQQIWGLPKERAVFQWEHAGDALRVGVVRAGELARIAARPIGPAGYLAGWLPFLSDLPGQALAWGVSGAARVHLARARVDLDPTSPFAELRPTIPLPPFVARVPILKVA